MNSQKHSALQPTHVEVETSTFCNRRCQWCPNSLTSRSQSQTLIKSELLDRLLDDLKVIEYSGYISMHNYNEPLHDPCIIEHIRKVHGLLPKSRVVIVSNGDRLDIEMLSKIIQHRVYMVRISAYDNAEFATLRKNLITQLQSNCINFIETYSGSETKIKVENTILVLKKIYPDMLSNRGGKLPFGFGKQRVADSPCLRPFTRCVIDVFGNMKICCEIYPNFKDHAKWGVVGSIGENSFLGCWLGERFNNLRRAILTNGNNNPICAICNMPNPEGLSSPNKYWSEYLITSDTGL